MDGVTDMIGQMLIVFFPRLPTKWELKSKVQSGRGTRMMGPKMGLIFVQRFGHEIGPKAFPDVVLVPLDRKSRAGSFLEGSQGHFRAKKGGKCGSQGAKNDQTNENWSENEVGRSFFWLTRDQIYFCRIEGIKIRPGGAGGS